MEADFISIIMGAIPTVATALGNALWSIAPFFIVPLILVIVLLILKTAWFKGLVGEVKVNSTIKSQLDRGKYRLLKNVTLPTKDGSTQIDHILVSRYGIFIIETKNMKGWIFGSEQQKQWTQKIHKNHKSRFQNPLHQNYKHIKTFASYLNILGANASYLNILEARIFSVIVFINGEFKTNMPDNVIYIDGLIDFIYSKQQPLFIESEVDSIYQQIQESRLKPGFKTHRSHIKHLKKNRYKKSH